MATTKKPAPVVSVLMSVYNAELYLEHAIRSMLEQTYTDFEFIIIDDGSTDRSLEIINQFDDPRIRLISRENKGLTASLNEGLELARGRYLARQDADDYSRPERFERQVSYLEAHPEVALLGTNYTIVDEFDQPTHSTRVFTHPDDLKVAEMVSNQFGHGSVMMRKSVLDDVGLYDPAVGIVEDTDLFCRISHVAAIANLRASLYCWRHNEEGVSLSGVDRQLAEAAAIRRREFTRFRERRREYRLFSSIHPSSVGPTPIHYLEKKARLLRSLGWLYADSGDRQSAQRMLVLAYLLTPWRRRNIRYLLRLRRAGELWDFEYV